jgi:hypothetical protein
MITALIAVALLMSGVTTTPFHLMPVAHAMDDGGGF